MAVALDCRSDSHSRSLFWLSGQLPVVLEVLEDVIDLYQQKLSTFLLVETDQLPMRVDCHGPYSQPLTFDIIYLPQQHSLYSYSFK